MDVETWYEPNFYTLFARDPATGRRLQWADEDDERPPRWRREAERDHGVIRLRGRGRDDGYR